jgi:hypothetical protein
MPGTPGVVRNRLTIPIPDRLFGTALSERRNESTLRSSAKETHYG